MSDDSDLSFLRGTLSTMLEASDEGFIVLDGGGLCRMIGRRAGEMFGIDAGAHVGKHGVEVLDEFARACAEPEAFWQAAVAPPGSPATVAEVDVRRPIARTVLCRTIALPRGADGAAIDTLAPGRIIFVRDVTLERAAESSTRQLRARLRALTPFDGLTGLLNQRRLYEELGREHSRSMRAWDTYALLRVDVDGMNRINDEFGVPSGDQVLEQVARRLETCVREYDVLARLEGDEFGILLPGADVIAARAVGERMIKAVAAEMFPIPPVAAAAASWARVDDRDVLRLAEPLLAPDRTVTVSIGGALWVPPSRQSAEAIFRRAGEALRDVRKQGGSRLHLFGC
ncbi:MAG: diguanylate cyclase [Myxococcota bacterium]|nr:diguanylate cyclase [Myxococcota bacterium]